MANVTRQSVGIPASPSAPRSPSGEHNGPTGHAHIACVLHVLQSTFSVHFYFLLVIQTFPQSAQHSTTAGCAPNVCGIDLNVIPFCNCFGCPLRPEAVCTSSYVIHNPACADGCRHFDAHPILSHSVFIKLKYPRAEAYEPSLLKIKIFVLASSLKYKNHRVALRQTYVNLSG